MSPQRQTVRSAAPHLDDHTGGPLVLVDADNTLWDTDGVFARAQLALLSDVEDALERQGPPDGRLDFVRSLDQALAEHHHLDLRYPPRLLIQAIALVLAGLSEQDAIRRAWRDGSQSGLELKTVTQIERAFFDMLMAQPDLLDGVFDGLQKLALIGATTVVLTEGSRQRVMQTIEHHRLRGYIDRVFEAPKTSRMFKRVSRLAKSEQTIFMIGDQLSRDIKPASEAGLATIYVPGAFRPKWELQAANVETLQATNFEAAVSLVIRENQLTTHHKRLAGA